jgi:hypothetical protein
MNSDFYILGSKPGDKTRDLIPMSQNCLKSKHGFGRCDVCKAKLVAYLEHGREIEIVNISVLY